MDFVDKGREKKFKPHSRIIEKDQVHDIDNVLEFHKMKLCSILMLRYRP